MLQVGIDQRVPLEVLEICLNSYFAGNLTDDYIKQQLELEDLGPNRLIKAFSVVNNIICNNPLAPLLSKYSEELQSAMKNETDKNVILISLLNTSYPFGHFILSLFGKYLKVQELVSTNLIIEKTADTYGSSRTAMNGMYSVISLLVEAGFISRFKKGLYQKNQQLRTSNEIAFKLYFESLRYNSSYEISSDEMYGHSNLHFFDTAYFSNISSLRLREECL